MRRKPKNPPAEPILNLAALLKSTRMVGPGARDAVWVQGCTLRCPGCANQSYLPHQPRVQMEVGRLLSHLRARRQQIDGISVLGGEPTEQPAAVAALLCGARELGLSTVVFTGRLYERLLASPDHRELLAHTDLLIDGPYLAARRDPDLHWRGSSNQRFIRLSNRFTEADLEPPQANGEIIVSSSRILLHGIGTRRLIDGS